MNRRPAALLLAAAAAAAGSSAAAQTIVRSPGPEAVSVTVYRNPQRGFAGRIDLEWLGGYALITETRTISLPAGESVVRFEGVAGGIIPVSAVVAGLPKPLSDKMHDARLISAGALVDAFLGRQVHIRRTDRATGRTTETEAVLRSGPDGVVLQTPDGVEALNCSGLPETLVWPEVPADLSDKPTLAVRTSADAPAMATIRLSYLATQFDWQANYVVSLKPDGKTLDLFAWMTLANGNGESFVGAQTQAVAGAPDKEEDEAGPEPVAPRIELRCWPRGTTSDVPYRPSVPGAELDQYEMSGQDIIVTGSRVRHPNLESFSPVTAISAEMETLGDLKLYRIPEPVTVAANGQKQVALLSKRDVPAERLHGGVFRADYDQEEPEPLSILLRMKNTKRRGLGLPLPFGSVAFFEDWNGRPMLVGESGIGDTAVGEDVELLIGTSPDVRLTHRFVPSRKVKPRKPEGDEKDGKEDEDDEEEDRYDDDRARRFEIELTNARPKAALAEISLWAPRHLRLVKPSRKLEPRGEGFRWRARVPAGGRARLSYTLDPEPEREEDEDED